jgi:hypothetical protein
MPIAFRKPPAKAVLYLRPSSFGQRIDGQLSEITRWATRKQISVDVAQEQGGLVAGGRAQYSHSHTKTNFNWFGFSIGLAVTLVLAIGACFVHPIIGVVIGVVGFLLSLVLPNVITKHIDTHHYGED